MKINARTVLLLFVCSFLPLALGVPHLLEHSFREMQNYSQLPMMEPSFQMQGIIAAFMVSGIIIGYYLYGKWIATSKRSVAIKIILGIFLYVLIAFIGIILQLPLLVICLYQWCIKHRRCFYIARDGISDMQADEFEGIDDIQARDLLRDFLKRRSRKKGILMGIAVAVSVILAMALGTVTFTSSEISLDIEGGSLFLFLALIFIISVLCVIMMQSIDRKLLAGITGLLYDRCDPYRTTMILEYLYDHKKANMQLIHYYLLCSLKEEDNRSRMKQLLPVPNKMVQSNNLGLVIAFSCLDDEEQDKQWDDFYRRNKGKIEELAKKPLYTKELVEEALHMLEANCALRHKEYPRVLEELNQVPSHSSKVQEVYAWYYRGMAMWESGRREEACDCFRTVIEEGNTLYFVENCREYLHQFDEMKKQGEQLELHI